MNPAIHTLSAQYAVPYNEMLDALESIEWWRGYYKLPPNEDQDLETLRAALDLAAQGVNLSETADALARNRYLPSSPRRKLGNLLVGHDFPFYLILVALAVGGVLVAMQWRHILGM